MTLCAHASIVQVDAAGGLLTLHDPKRLQRLSRELPNPGKQYPSILHFVGGKNKENAIDTIHKCKPHRPGSRSDGNSLRIDTQTITEQWPVLVAESDAEPPIFKPIRRRRCHEYTNSQVRWKSESAVSLWARLHGRLFLPFADVVCLFADDMGGVSGAVDFLAAVAREVGRYWALAPCDFRPRVLIVSSETNPSATGQVLELEELRHLLQETGDGAIKKTFPNVFHIQIASQGTSPRARYLPLRTALRNHSKYARDDRLSQRLLFSVIHLASFFGSAVVALARGVHRQVDLVLESRRDNPIREDFATHLQRFLRLGIKAKIPHDAAVSFLSSIVLLDAYPPGMHCKRPNYRADDANLSVFHPSDVYRTLYLRPLLRAVMANHSDIETDTLHAYCEKVEKCLISSCTYLPEHTAVQIYLTSMANHQSWWLNVKSNLSCLFCCRSQAEHALSCGHSMCSPCVGKFGQSGVVRELFTLLRCPLCAKSGGRIRLKPNTASASLLSIDGGGTRARIPLEYLKLLQDRIGVTPVQSLFDMVTGTSSGGLVAVFIWLLNNTVEESIRTFDTMSRAFFSGQALPVGGLRARVMRSLGRARSDSYYDTPALEAYLKEAFGTRKFFGATSGVGGTKVAVTASNLKGTATFLFTNYGKAHDESCSYPHIRPEDSNDEPELWFAVRTTTAAPFFFEPVHIPWFGGLQDGGMTENNPVNVLLSECRAVWPDIHEPDILLSLGTGTSVRSDTEAPFYRNVLYDNAAARAIRAFGSSLDGQRHWESFKNARGNKGMTGMDRLNVTLPESIPRLDDYQCMEQLGILVRSQNPDDVSRLSFSLLACRLYFTLDGKARPTSSGSLFCRGNISSQLSAEAFWASMDGIKVSPLELWLGDHLLRYLARETCTCPECGQFSMRIEFNIDSLDTPVDLHIKDAVLKHSISAFPNSISKFEKAQGLRSCFGTVDHGRPGQFRCATCSGNPTTKRRKPRSVEQKRKRTKPLPPIPQEGVSTSG